MGGDMGRAGPVARYVLGLARGRAPYPDPHPDTVTGWELVKVGT